MSSPAEISLCTQQDYNQILDELHEFWGARGTPVTCTIHSSFTSLETRRSSFATGLRSSRICLAFSRRPNRSDMCIRSLCGRPPVGKVSRVSFSATSWSSLAGTAAGTSRRSPRRRIWGPSHFTKASACSSSAKLISTELRCFPTMPAAARHAWFFENQFRRISSPPGRIGCTSLGPRSCRIRAGLGLRRERADPRRSPWAGNPVTTQVFGPRWAGLESSLTLVNAVPRQPLPCRL